MPAAALVVGVDGGGSKTAAVALRCYTDARGSWRQEEVGRFTGPASNRNAVGREAADTVLREAIQGVLETAECGVGDLAGVCLSLSGVDTTEDEEQVRSVVQSWLPSKVRVRVVNDALGALCSGTKGRLYGCVLICGTGSIAYGVSADGRHARSSGWGPLFLDAGSGYDTGQRALAAVARAADGRGPETSLTAALLCHLQLESTEALLRWAYAQDGWASIASLAPLVYEACEAGDGAARTIVWDAVSALVESVQAVASRLSLGSNANDNPFPIVLSGGGLAKDAPLRPLVIAKLSSDMPEGEVVVPLVDSATGAAMLAAKGL